jgi:hypothetical protein
LLGYEYFEKMYKRLVELEEKEEERILSNRIEDLEKNHQQRFMERCSSYKVNSYE